MIKVKRSAALLIALLTILSLVFPLSAMAASQEAPAAVAEATPSSVTWAPVSETVFARKNVNIRKGSGTSYTIVGKLIKGDAVKRIAIGSNGWSKVEYKGYTRYINSSYLVKTYPYSTPHYPMHYYDKTATITVTKEKYVQSSSHYTWCYVAHLQFTKYSRFSSDLAGGKWANSSGHYCWETTSHAAKRLGALLCISGDVNRESGIVKHSKVFQDTTSYHAPAAYNAYTGKLFYSGWGSAYEGKTLSTLVAQHKITDSFNFLWLGPLIKDGQIKVSPDNSYAQRTFMGTTGKAGDIYLVVSDGRKNDGVSLGLTSYQCAKLLKNKGCTFATRLDGGKSSTMVFLGMILNAARHNEQYILDFVYFK